MHAGSRSTQANKQVTKSSSSLISNTSSPLGQVDGMVIAAFMAKKYLLDFLIQAVVSMFDDVVRSVTSVTGGRADTAPVSPNKKSKLHRKKAVKQPDIGIIECTQTGTCVAPTPDDALISLPMIFRESDNILPSEYSLFKVQKVGDIYDLPHETNPLLTGGDFSNTPLHLFVMNQRYDVTSATLLHFNAQKRDMLNAIDNNEATPLLLALKVGAPPSLVRELITPENVMMADNQGLTPLMLAVRGADTSVTAKIMENIGEDRMQEALSAQDGKGWTVAEWNQASQRMLHKEFDKVAVDGTKASNHPKNHLLDGSQFNMVWKHHEEAEARQKFSGYELGIGYYNAQPHWGIKSTQKNAEALNYMVQKNYMAQKSAGNIDDKQRPLYTEFVDFTKMLSQNLNKESTEDLYKQRQEVNKVFLDDAREHLPSLTQHQDTVKKQRESRNVRQGR